MATPTIRRWPQLLTGSLVFLCVGLIYAWSIFAGLLKASFPSWSAKDLAATFTLIMAFFCLGNFCAGFLAGRMTLRARLLLSAVLTGLGYLGAALVQEHSLWLLYLSYGVLGSFGVGLAYNAVLSTVTRWFPDRIGAASGTLMMSFACSTLVLGVGAEALSRGLGWRPVMAGIALLTAAALAVGACILRLPEPGAPLPGKAAAGPRRPSGGRSCTPLEMVASLPFWLFFVWGIFLLVAVYGLMGNVKQCALELDPSAKAVATAAVTLLAIANGLGRLLLGSLYDRFGRIRTMTLDTLLIIASSGAMVLAFRTRSLALMLLGVALTGLAYGGVPPTSSAFVVDFFGAEDYPMKFGVVNLFIFVGAFGSALAGMIKDTAGSFEKLFYLLIVLGLLALGLNLMIRKPAPSAGLQEEAAS
jgi:OFA family oxalate/formate antiporter-like MFS transporter